MGGSENGDQVISLHEINFTIKDENLFSDQVKR